MFKKKNYNSKCPTKSRIRSRENHFKLELAKVENDSNDLLEFFVGNERIKISFCKNLTLFYEIRNLLYSEDMLLLSVIAGYDNRRSSEIQRSFTFVGLIRSRLV